MKDLDISFALIGQVTRALKTKKAPASEQDVTTFITRPMWRLWQEALGDDPDLDPTDWAGCQETRRVYGSRTIIIPGDQMVAVSV